MNDELEVLDEPSDYCLTILQDHGPGDGGWGPANVGITGIGHIGPIVYTRADPTAMRGLEGLCLKMAQDTGKKTILARFSVREDLFVVEGSS